MFTIRTYAEGRAETNLALGKRYTLYTKTHNEEACKEAIIRNFGDDFLGTLFGVIECEDQAIPLYYGDIYYIMTEGGKTYSVIKTTK